MRRQSQSHTDNLFAAGSQFFSLPALASAAPNAASSVGRGSLLSLSLLLYCWSLAATHVGFEPQHWPDNRGGGQGSGEEGERAPGSYGSCLDDIYV